MTNPMTDPVTDLMTGPLTAQLWLMSWYQSSSWIKVKMFKWCRKKWNEYNLMYVYLSRTMWNHKETSQKLWNCPNSRYSRCSRIVKFGWNSEIWPKETVNCNFSLMELKSAKNGLAQWFLSRKFSEVLIFWCPKRSRWKKLPSSRVVPKWCVFQPDMVQGCLGVSVSVCWCPLTPDVAFIIWGDI